MHRGYIKLWRKSIDADWLKNPKLWAFWCYCLIKASHKPRNAKVGFKSVPLEAGQFIFGRKQASKDLNIGEQTIRTCLSFLEKSGNLTIKSTNRFSIITVIKWEDYQINDDGLTNEKPTTNQQLTTDKNVKNEKKKDICQPQASDGVVVKPKIPKCPHTDIINLYHSKLPELSQISTKVVDGKEVYNWSGAREGYLRARWVESERRQSLEWWGSFFDLVRECKFLLGKVNGSNGGTFKANLEWLIKPVNFNKVVEGKYKR
jgi:hypothetical protein